jgi:two-component system, chemotaxis family, CheB/CheR fusion protein
VFEDVTPPEPERKRRMAARTKEQRAREKREDPRVDRLERELAANREHLQSIIQELEAANEELQSANEEILSSNEELQSTNEELDTAKEELQSTNEELNTVNEELHGRNEELSRVNGDLVNLLASVQIAIVMVSRDLRIRRFTPMAERVLNLIPTDVGRPIGDIKPNIECPDLEALISEVIDTMVIREREVRYRQGGWYTLRIRPYKNLENRIDGAVLALFDNAGQRGGRGDEVARSGSELAQKVLDSIRELLVVLDPEQRILRTNAAFERALGIEPERARDRVLHELLGELGADPRPWRALIDGRRLETGGAAQGLEVRLSLPGAAEKRFRAVVFPLAETDGAGWSILADPIDE